MELKYVLNAPVTFEITPEESQRGEKAPGYSRNIWLTLHFKCIESFCFNSTVDGMCRPSRGGRKCVSLRSAKVTSGMLILNHRLSLIIRYCSFQQFMEGLGNFSKVKLETFLEPDIMFM